MSDPSQDAGVIQMVLERLETQRLPRALELKERVDRGERLAESDIHFMELVFSDARMIGPMLGRHPEYEKLVGRVVQLYKDIMDKALENEKKA